MKFIVDSGVWIDLFAGRITAATTQLLVLVEQEHRPLVGDLVLTEVLQGTRDRYHLDRMLVQLSEFDRIDVVGHEVALQAAAHYQHLRGLGITVRRTIDTLIAARCIRDALPLLYTDRDFHPFVEHRGLCTALDIVPGAS